MKRSYDTIAFVYDRLSRLVFASKLIRAQQYLVKAIPPGSNILIVGGGTGWILDEIRKIHPSGLSITYVDSSAKMIALAQKRNTGANKVKFIPLPIDQMMNTDAYDTVLTAFFFDNFTDAGARKIFSFIDSMLSRRGQWLYCDFHNTDVFWQKKMLKFMYLFFRVSCGIEAERLPDVESCFARCGYKVKEQKTFFNGFIVSKIYKR